MVAKRKRCFIVQFHVKSSRAFNPYLMDFLEIFTSVKYHRDMKIKAVPKQFRVYGIFKKITN